MDLFHELFECNIYPIAYLFFYSILAIVFIIRKRQIDRDIGENVQKVTATGNKKTRFIIRSLLLFMIAARILTAVLINGDYIPMAADSLSFSFLLSLTFFAPYAFVGDNGVAITGILIKWDDINNIEWDRDIKQRSWGMKIYRKDKKVPLRIFFPRNKKEEIDDALKKLGAVAIN